MKLTGTVTEILDLEQGTSKAGKEWVKRSFVVDTGAKYNPLVCIECFGEEKVAMLSSLEAGEQVEVSINISSREYKGRYYTQVSAWEIATLTATEVEEDENMPF